MERWQNNKKILCIRTDNMGDLIMSIPAIHALKETFSCRITLLTSFAAASAAAFIPDIADVLSYNAPWNRLNIYPEESLKIINILRAQNFDAAVIFTVYSQNPLPAAMLAFMAGIPERLAYCRENPYGLLTHWIPDKEPYSFIQHQVKRDLNLVKAVGAVTSDDRLTLHVPGRSWKVLEKRLLSSGLNLQKKWIIMHAGVSEEKRTYPREGWVKAGKGIIERFDLQLVFTGTASEAELIKFICTRIGPGAFDLSGGLDLEAFITLIRHSTLVVSVNTATIHIAAAVNTPVVVLYALTNPQHTPWKGRGKLLYYHPPEKLRSKNMIVADAYRCYLEGIASNASPDNIVDAVESILSSGKEMIFPEVIQ